MNEKEFLNIDLNLLVTFQVLMRERNVTRAAEKLSRGQSAVSASLARLRQMFNDPLFVRTLNGIEPTERAISLSHALEPLMGHLSHVIHDSAPFNFGKESKTFVISSADDFELFCAPALLSRISREAPNVRLSVRQSFGAAGSGKRDLVHNASETLDSGDVDLFVAALIGPLAPWHNSEPLANCSYVCVYDPKAHRIKGPVDLDYYLQAPHILVSFRGDFSGTVDEALDRIDRQRKVTYVTSRFSTVPFLLKDTGTLATMPVYVAKTLTEHMRLKVSPLPFEIPTFSLQLIWHRKNDHNPAHIWLRDMIKETFQQRWHELVDS